MRALMTILKGQHMVRVRRDPNADSPEPEQESPERPEPKPMCAQPAPNSAQPQSARQASSSVMLMAIHASSPRQG